MARGNTYTCATCGKEYDYCPKCAITKPSYEAERYCSKDHEDIFKILSKNGCHNATDAETLKALNDYDITGLTESVTAHINSLKPVAAVKEEVVETPKKKMFRTQE